MTTNETTEEPEIPSPFENPNPKPKSAYIFLPGDVLAALPALLRSAGLDEPAEKVETQLTQTLSARDRHAYIEAGRGIYCNEGDDHRTEIDHNAIVSDSEDGAYVMAWCWVYKRDAGFKQPSDDDYDADDADTDA